MSLADYPHPKYLTCIVSEANRNHVLDVVRFARDQRIHSGSRCLSLGY